MRPQRNGVAGCLSREAPADSGEDPFSSRRIVQGLDPGATLPRKSPLMHSHYGMFLSFVKRLLEEVLAEGKLLCGLGSQAFGRL